jgi:DNA-binding NarL/FixJ family response regulator
MCIELHLSDRDLGGEDAGPAGSFDPGALDYLSHREVEVLRLTALSWSRRDIAARMHIDVKTVATCQASAMARLGFRTRIEVIRFGLTQGWLKAGDKG